jgi:hypothetical protein
MFNQIPRDGGKFFNMQANTYVNHPGVTFIKIAMFDEVDEGTIPPSFLLSLFSYLHF